MISGECLEGSYRVPLLRQKGDKDLKKKMQGHVLTSVTAGLPMTGGILQCLFLFFCFWTDILSKYLQKTVKKTSSEF